MRGDLALILREGGEGDGGRGEGEDDYGEFEQGGGLLDLSLLNHTQGGGWKRQQRRTAELLYRRKKQHSDSRHENQTWNGFLLPAFMRL